MPTARAFLIYRGDGAIRTTTRRPRLRADEIAWPITINIPPGWGLVQPSGIALSIPDSPALATVGEPMTDEDGAA